MMALSISTPWHLASYDRFINERLPELLADRLPLSGYQAECDEYTCRLKVVLGEVEMEYEILRPDEWGVFQIRDGHMIVLPVASSEYLDTAEIKCVGEQLFDYVSERLGEAPKDVTFDQALMKSWLPLDTWVAEAVEEIGQWLDETDRLATITHSRRLLVPTREKVITPSQFGRTCPFNTPEGPNIGRVLDIAVGARIEGSKLVIVDDRPEASLGMVASMVPFLENSDANRVSFGVNMMRQWMVPPEPEPALVQTGNEFSAPGFWCGRNLLTAFVSWGRDTYEDGILISESAAKRFNYPEPMEPGDKISNRHGTKGVISRIVPDDEMPHMQDGTPVDLVYSFIALHTRLNLGQLREAIAGRIARAEGTPFVAPPFHAPSIEELKERLKKVGLPESGMETLTLDKGGKKLDRPSTVGYVYWGKTVHLAHDKIFWGTRSGDRACRQGENEYYAMRDVGAYELIREQFNTRSARREGAETFPERVATGPIEQAGPPTPDFEIVRRRLAAGGILAGLKDDKLTFRFGSPEGEALRLAHPVPHPWLQERMLDEITHSPIGEMAFSPLYPDGHIERLEDRKLPPAWTALVEANTRMGRMISTNAPESLRQRAYADLESAVKAYFDLLLMPENLRFHEAILLSGRAVLAPGVGLRTDQVGIPDEMAWAFFGPLVARDIGMSEVEARSDKAAEKLDEIMARSWVIVNRAPTFMPTALLAFHPTRSGDRTIRLHPLALMLNNGDYDGDQAAVFVPLTEAGQKEAGECLSIGGHLRRDPSLVRWVFPNQEALWGLATMSMTDPKSAECGTRNAECGGISNFGFRISDLIPEGYITRESIIEALMGIVEREGVDRMLEVSEKLLDFGLQIARESGASLSPFVGESLRTGEKWDRHNFGGCEDKQDIGVRRNRVSPDFPESDDPKEWEKYSAAITEALEADTDFAGDDLGPQLLAVKSRARGTMRWLLRLVGSTGMVERDGGRSLSGLQDGVPIRHGLSEGLTSEEVFALVPSAREGLSEIALETLRGAYSVRDYSEPKGFNVLDRAMRAKYPGIVFADAAANGEVDPLTSIDARLFVGLEVTADERG